MGGLFVDRLAMTLAYEAVMANRHDLLHDQQRLEYGRNLLKSFIVEVDTKGATPDEALAMLIPQERGTIDVTDDEVLFAVRLGDTEFMVEFLDDRFLVFHSLDAADGADQAMLGLTHTRLADSVWLTSDYLRDLFGMGQPLGFSTTFDSAYFLKRSRPETRLALSAELRDELGRPTDPEDAGIGSLNIRMSGRDAAYALETLEKNDYLAAHLPLSSAKLSYGPTANVDEVRYDGRLVARGPSFAEHTRMVEALQKPYAAWLRKTESELTFRAVSEDGALSLDGEPIIVPLQDAKVDVPRLLTRLLSGSQPFRFWGVPRQMGTDSYYVTASDLHGAGILRMDVTPRLIRIYLERGTCANSVLRIFVNLQQMVNRNLILVAADTDISPRMRPGVPA